MENKRSIREAIADLLYDEEIRSSISYGIFIIAAALAIVLFGGGMSYCLYRWGGQ
jgi:hypothetical protein